MSKKIISAVFRGCLITACVVLTSCSIRMEKLELSGASEKTQAEVSADNSLLAAGTDAAATLEDAPEASPEAAPPEGGDDMVLIYSTTEKFTGDMTDCEFKLYGITGGDGVYEAMLLQIDDTTRGRRLFDTPFQAEGNLEGAHIILADANFDGSRDVLVTEGPLGAHGHLSYRLLPWNDAGNTLQDATANFSEILNPVIDGQDKVIRSLGANSAFEDCYQIYRYLDGEYYLDTELLLTRGEVNGRETLTYTPYQYVNGIPQPLSVAEISEPPDPNHPDLEAYYGADSLWKLDDAIWYDSAHFKGITNETTNEDGLFIGVILEGRFYHDARAQWITYYYMDVGKTQYDILSGQLGGVGDTGQRAETEIQIYGTDESVPLEDHVGEKIVFRGEFFEANTIYHQRAIVFEIKEMGTALCTS